MKVILFLLLSAVGISNAQLPRKIVVGGNGNSTLGQIVAGNPRGFHVGIRTPITQTTSVQDTSDGSITSWIAPNPCERVTRIIGEKPRSITVFTLSGNEVPNCVNMTTGEIKFNAAGTYIIKMVLTNGITRTLTVISK